MVEERRTHFEDVVANLPRRLRELLSAPKAPRSTHGSIPEAAGIYLFSEASEHIYVGQTRRLRSRLRQHIIPSSSQESASFAFLLAREDASNFALDIRGSRRDTATHAEFVPLFLAAKERVARMDVQFIEMDDPIERTIFEIYTALHLGTERYNSFETH